MSKYDDSPEYCRMRAQQERRAEANAKQEGIKKIHRLLADKYIELAEKAEIRALDIEGRPAPKRQPIHQKSRNSDATTLSPPASTSAPT
jgi:hypothetical protein